MFYEDIKELQEILRNGNYFYYNIYVFLGLNSWVLVKKFEILDFY